MWFSAQSILQHATSLCPCNAGQTFSFSLALRRLRCYPHDGSPQDIVRYLGPYIQGNLDLSRLPRTLAPWIMIFRELSPIQTYWDVRKFMSKFEEKRPKTLSYIMAVNLRVAGNALLS